MADRVRKTLEFEKKLTCLTNHFRFLKMVLRTKLFIMGGLIFCILVFLSLRALKSTSELSEDKFAEVYIQLSIAKKTFASDTLKLKEEKERIFKQVGVTQVELNALVKRLNEKPQRWSRVWKKIVEKLEERRSAGSEAQNLK